MNKLTLLIIQLLSIFNLCNAQEEVFFNNTNINKKDIKIEENISGIDFNTDLVRILPGQYMGLAAGSIETQINYFHENRIADTWSLYKSIGLSNSFYNSFIRIGSDPYGYEQTETKYLYGMALELKIEPRWYFNYKSRYMGNMNTRNNSAWFLSLPLSISTNIMNQTPNGGYQWITDNFNMSIISPLTIGFRNAFSKSCFIEASIGYIPLRAWFYNGNFLVKSADKIGLLSADSFNSEIKFGYTF